MIDRWLRSPGAWIAALALVLALLLPGLRGIWDADEGRYTNVALQMVDSGDWLSPHRSEHTGHWTKPPLTYWAIAASVEVFGRNPWAARLPGSLAYLLCAWLAFRIARRLAPGSERVAALAFATMLVPFGAAHYITTDFLLAAVGDWHSSLPNDRSMWVELGIGRKVMQWFEAAVAEDDSILSKDHPRREAIDLATGWLVAFGVAEAHEFETRVAGR